jgi:hypothetical protein
VVRDASGIPALSDLRAVPTVSANARRSGARFLEVEARTLAEHEAQTGDAGALRTHARAALGALIDRGGPP